jgi:hypothetical protein
LRKIKKVNAGVLPSAENLLAFYTEEVPPTTTFLAFYAE